MSAAITNTKKPSLEVAPTTKQHLADHEFSSGRDLFTVFKASVRGFLNLAFTFQSKRDVFIQ